MQIDEDQSTSVWRRPLTDQVDMALCYEDLGIVSRKQCIWVSTHDDDCRTRPGITYSNPSALQCPARLSKAGE